MSPPETNPRAGPAPTLRTHYLALLTPLVLTHALQSAGGLLDGFWLGRLLGVRGIATAASFFPVFFLLLSLIIGLGAGATILAGQAWGARDPLCACDVAGNALRVRRVDGLVPEPRHRRRAVADVIVAIEFPLAMALKARFGLAGVFWAVPATFLAMLVLHGLYYLYDRNKEKEDGRFRQSGVALGAAGGRAPSA